MSFFELVLMRGNCFREELFFFRSVWVVPLGTLSHDVPIVAKLSGIR